MNIKIGKFGEGLTGLINGVFASLTGDDYFISGVTSYRDVYAMACAIKAFFDDNSGAKKTVCICTEDKGVIAASILASIAGGPDLVLPHAYSDQVLAETREYTGYSGIISDNTSFPDDLNVFMPYSQKDTYFGQGVLSLQRELDSDFLYLFTGGSTGKSKVWPKTVRNVFAEALYLSKKYSFSSKDRILATVPPYHIYGFLFSVMIPLVSSAQVVQRVCTFPREIINAIEQEGPTILVSVPVHYRILKGSVIGDHVLRMAFSSAGPLNPEDGEAFTGTSGTPVVEVYGSTETGGIATRCRAKGETSLRSFDSVDWKIMDERLCVRSELISPALPVDEDGFFMTGDRVEKDGTSSFKLLGRVDGIVKVGGKRVDLGDVEEKIRSIEGVKACIVIALDARSGKDAEIAAVVEGSVTDEQLRERLRKLLEPSALPRKIKIVDKVPTMSTGKIDRKKIQKLFI